MLVINERYNIGHDKYPLNYRESVVSDMSYSMKGIAVKVDTGSARSRNYRCTKDL